MTSRWDETFLVAFTSEAPRDCMGAERMARYAMLFAAKAGALGLDARKAGLLAARMIAEIDEEARRRARVLAGEAEPAVA